VEQNTAHNDQKLKHRMPKNNKRQRYLLIASILGTVLVTITSLILYYVLNNLARPVATNNPSAEQQAYYKDFIDSDDSELNKAELSNKYSQTYANSLQSTSNTNPAEWNREKVNEACRVLLYVDKMGSYSQALQYVALLQEAKINGVNIDDNDYGVNQKVRDDIYNKSKQESDNAASEN